MRLHILGICGTFMSGVAILAKQAGHQVTGSDRGVYPPMSTQLMEQGIQLMEGYEASHIDANVDCVIVGNVIKRGNPAIEHVLAQRIPYMSGPEWLAKNILHDRQVLAVAGTHGKTTASSMLAWMLEDAGLQPGFLIGGIPNNFDVSARLGDGKHFVIEADEYDSAFFDKRSKFIHYHPDTLILNNLEFDHADIFSNLDAIKLQFHYLIRTVPGNGLIIYNADDAHLAGVLDKGCWTKTITFGSVVDADLRASLLKEDGSAFTLFQGDRKLGDVSWYLLGDHNVNNALAAIAAAQHAGVSFDVAMHALSSFASVKRRLEVKGIAKNMVIYDDFAHHPTAMATTLKALRAKVGRAARIIAVVEFGSYTMRSGLHKQRIKEALSDADQVVCKDTEADWGLRLVLAEFEQPTAIYQDVETLVTELVPHLQAGDHIVVMSNAGFGGIHNKLIKAIEKG